MLDCVYVRALQFENYFYFKENANEVVPLSSNQHIMRGYWTGNKQRTNEDILN